MRYRRPTRRSRERVVIESNGGLLTLTNYRVRYDVSTASESRYLTITLDAVDRLVS